MNSKFVVKLALSTAFVAVPAMTASTAGFGSSDKVSAKKAGPEKAYGWAKKAEKALAKGKTDRALTFAELAVEADMQNRDYRGLLARIYMSQGRFVSAERTLMDVMDLGQVDPRTVISLALTRIAQGNVDSADFVGRGQPCNCAGERLWLHSGARWSFWRRNQYPDRCHPHR